MASVVAEINPYTHFAPERTQTLFFFGKQGPIDLYSLSQGTGQMASKLTSSDGIGHWAPLLDE